MDAAIAIRDVSKRFRLYHDKPDSLKERVIRLRRRSHEDLWALQDVTLDINRGETFGLVGPNGSGKTTLLRCIAGILRPTTGSISSAGRMASLLELGAGFHPDLTGRENIFINASILGLTRKETEKYFDAIVAFSELENFIDMQVKHYSSGMYVRLGFAVAVHVDPDILLVDEILAVGDEKFQRKCLNRIRAFQDEGRTIVIVTHAIDMVPAICTRACALFRGEVAEVGEPNGVVHTFRQKIHGIETQAPDPISGPAQILDVTIRGPQGDVAAVLSPGESCEITVDVQFNDPVDDPAISMLLRDTDNKEIFRTSTRLRQMAFGRLEGKVRFRFMISELALLTPTCYVSFGLHDSLGHTLHSWQRATGFHVHAKFDEHGIVYLPYEVLVETL